MKPSSTNRFDHDRRSVLGLGLMGGLAMMATPARGSDRAAARIRRLSPALDRIVAADAAIETVTTGIRWAEGPLWVEKGGYLLFSDPPANFVRCWRRGAAVVPFLAPSGPAHADPALVREAGPTALRSMPTADC